MAKKKTFSKAERTEFEGWLNGELKEGAGLLRIMRRAKTRYAAFDWSMVFAILFEIIKKWMESRK